MNTKPINFNDLMVKAILDGRKTVTRRPIKSSTVHSNPITNQQYIEHHKGDEAWKDICPYGKIGDTLWVREPFKIEDSKVLYRADFIDSTSLCLNRYCELIGATPETPDKSNGYDWLVESTMPQSSSRITLKIVDITIQRVQQINDNDSFREGILHPFKYIPEDDVYVNSYPALNEERYKISFSLFWDQIYKDTPYEWNKNPWVWVIEFQVDEIKGGNVSA